MPLGPTLALIWAAICGLALGGGSLFIADMVDKEGGDGLAAGMKWFAAWTVAWIVVTAIIIVAFPV